jgi:hypothetical protein
MTSVLLVTVFLMLLLLIVAVLALLFRKPPRELNDLATQAALIKEKIERVESIPNEVNALKVEVGKLSERVSGVEQGQNNVNQAVCPQRRAHLRSFGPCPKRNKAWRSKLPNQFSG